MKEIMITEKNYEKITAAIKEAEGKATARTVTYTMIAEAIRKMEKEMDISKKSMTGIVADIDINAQDFPRAYKYTPESTHVIVERTSSGWKLTHVSRHDCRRASQVYKLTLTDEAKAAIIARKEIFA